MAERLRPDPWPPVAAWPPWKMMVWARLQQVRVDVVRALDLTEAADIIEATCMFANTAYQCLTCRGLTRLRQAMSGKGLMDAYTSLHSAEKNRLKLMSGEQLQAVLPMIRDRVRAYLPADHPYRSALDGIPDLTTPTSRALRDHVAGRSAAGPVRLTEALGEDQLLAAEVFGATCAIEDFQQEQVRRFRGGLGATSVVVFALAAFLGILGFVHPAFIPLCLHATKGTMCPSGGKAPGRADAFLILGAGAVGATLTVVRTLSELKPAGVRFTLSVAQGLVKIALGAITALIGIMILQTQSLPGSFATQTGILISAVVFGFGQQLITGLLDQRATKLMNSASSQTPSGSDR